MLNPIAVIEGFFVGLFKGIFDSGSAKQIEQSVVAFVKTDVGALAVDAVEFVASEMPGTDGVAKRDAAVAKLKTDAAAAGKDLSALAESTLNWFVETALQYVVTKGIAAAA
jgi:hypothetical protein